MTSSYPELYTKNVRIWVKHPTEVWQCAVVQKDFDKSIAKLHYISDEDQEEICLEIKDNASLPPLRNPDILIGANDLTSLSYLHEPSVLYNLRVRFLQHNSIYTWCGIVLVAVNPFSDLEIYGEETIRTYHSNSALAQLDPHIYAVAEDAFTKLERNDLNQSVIVSGESGAGKTVSAKFAMRYFASIAGSDSNIESRVLASNPIMEAIGNAKTIRNDNSSRFGKYIQILFDRKTQAIMGGNMRTYLLEKSRVTYQGEGERNFHIFYQLCSWAKQNGLDHLGLNDCDFVYLGSNEKTPYDDMSRFVEALDTLGFTDKQKNVIYVIIAAILHGGNIEFVSLDDERCTISDDSEGSLKKFCELLSINSTHFLHWLTNRVLRGREAIIKPNTKQEAKDSLEATLKYLYEKLFLWIVNFINAALGPPGQLNEYQFIGVLDIYGFEHFETNSFEQFCINYANEVLQQQFNLHVFKLEQEEYVREGINWEFITFNDNQMVIDLIESKPIGILSLLDEESRFPKGSDESWCAKLYAQITTKGEVFKKPKFSYQKSFIIQHFADVVTYSASGFLEKNKDTISEEQVDLLKRSEVLDGFFIEDAGTSAPSTTKQGAGGRAKIMYNDSQGNKGKQKAKATVGSQFRESLEALMKILNSTEPHYVRCIKPNDNKGAFEFNNIRAVQQLRACGVLETIRISSNGFPSRWSYQDFANRYRVLRVGHQDKLKRLRTATNDSFGTPEQHKGPKPTPRKIVRPASDASQEIRQICEDIVKIVYEEKVYAHFNLNRTDENSAKNGIGAELSKQRQLYQFGKTKIFFRPGQVALLERIRSQKLRECAILLQQTIRGWLERRRYLRIKQSVLLLQRYGRAYIARKRYLHLRQTRAATRIQTAWRAYHQRQRYALLRRTVISLQTYGRGFIARRKFDAIRQNLAAITIQRYWRGYIARKRYHIAMKRIILAQSCIRRYLAKRELKQLRIEARSVEHVTNLNRGLEKKIIELQQRIDELSEENRLVRLTSSRYDTLRADFETMESEILRLKTKEKEDIIAQQNFKTEIEKLNAINHELNNKLDSMKKKNVELIEKMKTNAEKAKHAENDSKKVDDAIREREQQLRQEFERERRMFQAELQREQSSKQQLLSKVMDLESNAATVERSKSDRTNYEQRASVVSAVAAAAMAAASATGLVRSTPSTTTKAAQITPMKSSLQTTPNTSTPNPNEIAKLDLSSPIVSEKRLSQLSPNISSPNDTQDFDNNLQQISVMMRCSELEQEIEKVKCDNQKLRRQMAKYIDNNSSNVSVDGTVAQTDKIQAGATLLAEQFADQQEELERYKKERADLKKVILIEDWITTNGGIVDEKYQNNLLSVYKSLYTQLDEEIAKKEKIIHKLKNENIYLKMSGANNKSMNSLTVANSGGFVSLDPTSLETMEIDPSICYQGMYKFKQSDIDFIIRFLIYDVGPQNAFKCDSQTVACVIYMCIRYIDQIKNEDMVQLFMTQLVAMMKKKVHFAITKNALESLVHVMSTAFMIAIMIKYYSEYDIDRKQNDRSIKNGSNGDSGAFTGGGEDSIENGNGQQQGKDDDYDYAQSLKNFDLTDYADILRNLITWIYLKLSKLFQQRINNLIVPALLENKELASSGADVHKSIQRSGSISTERESPPPTEKEIHTLIKELSNIETMFRMHKLDEELVHQFFKQTYYFMGTTCLNNLLMRKDLCNNNIAMQIIYNLSYLEQFLREHNIPNWEMVKSMLDPITQATKLLFTNKSDKQISAILFTTEALTISQISKIINMYTPTDEEHISSTFIKNLTFELQKSRNPRGDEQVDKAEKMLIMKTQDSFPLTISFLDQKIDEKHPEITETTVAGLRINLKEIELPLLLKGLEKYLEKI